MSDLDTIKNILFGNEKKALDALTRRLEARDSRVLDVADVLPDAIDRSYDQDPRLRSSLREPIEDSIGDAVRRDPNRFADALFPVIGPAIRKSIAEALRSLVSSFNRAAETSLSPSARFHAWRAGVPLGEWVLRNSLIYRVDEVYLINPDSGLLIEHVSHQDAPEKDEDAVSAMLTAIQDFVRDSFSAGKSALNSAAIGEFTVWVSNGPSAMLAAVVRGAPPAELRTVLESTLERIHLNHARALRAFDGRSIRGVDTELEDCLRFQLRDEGAEKSGMSWPLRLFLLALAAALVWWLVNGFLQNRKLDAWGEALRAEPGIVVTGLERDGRQFVATGLRDPLAALPAELADGAGIEQARVQTDFRPFQSLDEGIVLARAQAVLAPPESVRLTFADGTLRATGTAAAAWRQRADTLAAAIGGIDTADFSAVTTSDADLLASLREQIEEPAEVTLSVRNGAAIATGVASAEWIERLRSAAARVAGIRRVDESGLATSEILVLRRLAAGIDGQNVYFSDGDTLAADQERIIARLSGQLAAFGRSAQALGLTPGFAIVGHTDDSGAAAINRELQIARALAVSRRLAAGGVEPGWLSARRADSVGEGSDTTDRSRRRATIYVLTTAPDGTPLVNR